MFDLAMERIAKEYEGWANPYKQLETSHDNLNTQFLFIIDVSDVPHELIVESLESLNQQTSPNWMVWLISNEEDRGYDLLRSAGIDKDRGRVVSPTRNVLVEAFGDKASSHVVLLHAGDRLKSYALLVLNNLLAKASVTPDLIYCDNEFELSDGALVPFFKPEWSPLLFDSIDYLSQLTLYSSSAGRELLEKTTMLPTWPEMTRMILSITPSERIAHLASPCSITRVVPEVLSTPAGDVKGDVTIIIPSRNRGDLVRRCIESISVGKYQEYSILLIDNESDDPVTVDFLEQSKHKVLRYPYAFNYARMMNLAAKDVTTEYILFLNNDIEAISTDWMQQLIRYCSRQPVGAVGARLLYPDGTVHHEGITLNRHGVSVAHIDFDGFLNLGKACREVAAVTGACLMTKKRVFCEAGGFDERMEIGYNDVDYCLRLNQLGLKVVYCGSAELFHVTGATRGDALPLKDELFFIDRWKPMDFVDPYFSQHWTKSWPVGL